MIYRNSEIDSDYNRIAELSDNYIVWVRESSLKSGQKYNAYVQLLSPSFSYYFTSDYTISSGSDTVYNAHYINNGMYSYIDYYDVETTLTTQSVSSDYITDNEYTRFDFPLIFVCQFIIVVMFVWVFNKISRLFFKGGL